MSATAEDIEEKLASTIAASYSGANEESYEDEPSDVKQYEFDGAFQLKIATLLSRDRVFARRVDGLIKPDYFEDAAVATLVNLSMEHWARYREVPSPVAYVQILKTALTSGKIRKDLKDSVKEAFKKMMKANLADRDFVADEVAAFARHQSIYKAMMDSADLMARGQYDRVAELVKKAAAVGINNADVAYDYFAEIEHRSQARKDKVAGIKPPQGITTGIKKIDALLYNNGWGRKELSLLMGGAKAGKSTGLLFFAKNAALAGFNTLYVTLEMSSDIASSRIDASISETEMKELEHNIGAVEDLVKAAGKNAGRLFMAQMPGYSLTPSGLRRLVDNYASDGIRFDLLVIDYLDLMAPDHRTNDPIENSKNIYVGVRAIGQEEDMAVLSATQTNREGFKAITAKAEHAADDFNKIRIADITITINATDDERDRGEARLYFAASRNEKGGIMVQIKTEVEKMIFIKSVLGIL